MDATLTLWKKQMLSFRIVIVIFFAAYIFIFLYRGNFTTDSFISIIPMVILLTIFELLFSSLFVLFLKGHLKSLKKKGKMEYSPSSTIEFYEDSFVEITPDNKTEQRYSSIERISIVDDKMVYIMLIILWLIYCLYLVLREKSNMMIF